MFKLYCCVTHSKKLYGSGIMSLVKVFDKESYDNEIRIYKRLKSECFYEHQLCGLEYPKKSDFMIDKKQKVF